MTQNKEILKRYALEFIRESGGTANIENFLKTCNQGWSKQNFEDTYKNFCQNSSAGENASQENTRSNNQSTNPTQTQNPTQIIYVNVHDSRNSRWDFWDHLLFQLWIDSLFNRSHVNNGHTSNQGKKQKSEDDNKSSAGILVLAVIIIFHVLICCVYNIKTEQAREEEKIDYLDNKLKMFRNIEFIGCAVSLIALIACAVYPVLPTWGLIALSVSTLICALGGVAFQKKHEKESKNIEKAGVAVDKYLGSPPSYDQATANDNPQPSAPPPESGFDFINLSRGQQYPSTHQTQPTFN